MEGWYLLILGFILTVMAFTISKRGIKHGNGKLVNSGQPASRINIEDVIVKKTYRFCQQRTGNDREDDSDSVPDTFAPDTDGDRIDESPDVLPRETIREYSESIKEEYSSHVATPAFEGEEQSELDSDIMDRMIPYEMIARSEHIVSSLLAAIPEEETNVQGSVDDQHIYTCDPEVWEEMLGYEAENID